MIRTLRQWLGMSTPSLPPVSRSVKWIPQQEIPTNPASTPRSMNPLLTGKSAETFIPFEGLEPQQLFPVLRRLRDFIPDVSAGVWAWVRLCSTPQTYTLSHGDKLQADQATQILSDFDRRIGSSRFEREGGIEALMQNFFLSVFTYGSFCGEVVLDESRSRIERFVVIDPASIRFKLEHKTRDFHPYQMQSDGSFKALNRASFYYFGLDTDGLNPYGRSPLMALPLMIQIQQQFLMDMNKSQHNAGYPTIHFKVKPPQKEQRESLNRYHERLQSEMDNVKSALMEKDTDSNLVTYDNIDINYIGPGGNQVQWSESFQVISEQVISALHLAPFMLGRNWGTTQSWGNAQYQLLTNNARSVQQGGKRLAEWLQNLELILHGSPLSVSRSFSPHHHLDLYDRARAFKTSAETIAELSNKDLMDSDDAKQHINNLLKFL